MVRLLYGLLTRRFIALKKDQPFKTTGTFLLNRCKSRISMRDSRNMALGNLMSFEITPGGDGEEAEESNPFGAVTVRKKFKTVPYWNPSIRW